MSRLISLLEEELGVPLFVRTANKHLSIKPACQYLLKRAQQIVELEDETKENLKQFNMNLTGMIHFGASESISWIHVVKRLKEFKELYPNKTCRIRKINVYDSEKQDITERTGIINASETVNIEEVTVERNDAF